ncbi:MAG: hypothetical protein KA369_08505 [Spirochaetes bacterium]|nr:hypothetical protein [Spirochaetota bacterium]
MNTTLKDVADKKYQLGEITFVTRYLKLPVEIALIDVKYFLKRIGTGGLKNILRVVNSIILLAILIVALEVLSVMKSRMSNIQESTNSINSEIFDLNSTLTRWMMTGQIGDYLNSDVNQRL